MPSERNINEGGLVSFIIPVYNTEAFIGKCLDSILGQSYSNLEVIAVDDGSKDGSARVLAEYAAKDKRIRVLSQPNSGQSVARNKALDALTPQTEYVCFVDSDDWIPADALSSMMACMEQKNADLVIGLYDVVNKEDTSLQVCPETHLGQEDVASTKEMFDLLTFHLVSNYSQFPGKLYRRHTLDGFHFPPSKVFEDSLCHRVFGKCDRIAFLNKVVYHYLWREGSTVHSGFDIRRLDKVEMFIDRIKYFRETGFPDYSVACLAQTYMLLRTTLLGFSKLDGKIRERTDAILQALRAEYRQSSFSSLSLKERFRHWMNHNLFWLTYYRVKLLQKSSTHTD